MARQKGTLQLGSNIEPRMAAPLDARTVVEYKTDLTNPSSYPYCYKGMVVSVKNEGRQYMLNGDDPTVMSNWIDAGAAPDMEEMSLSEIKDIWDVVFNPTSGG